MRHGRRTHERRSAQLVAGQADRASKDINTIAFALPLQLRLQRLQPFSKCRRGPALHLCHPGTVRSFEQEGGAPMPMYLRRRGSFDKGAYFRRSCRLVGTAGGGPILLELVCCRSCLLTPITCAWLAEVGGGSREKAAGRRAAGVSSWGRSRAPRLRAQFGQLRSAAARGAR